LFFKHIPLPYALGILVGLFVLYQIRKQLIARESRLLLRRWLSIVVLATMLRPRSTLSCRSLSIFFFIFPSAEKEKKLQNLDENAIQDILGTEEALDEEKKKADAKKKQKAKNKVQQRLASEKKAEARKTGQAAKKSKGGDENDAAEDDDLAMFAKGAREKTGKKKQ